MSEPMEDKRLERSVEEIAEVCSVARSLRDKNDAIKELLNGASLHPETGVSLIDDVRDLVKERDRLTYAIGEWKKEEVLWKEREADLLAKLSVAKNAMYKVGNNVCDNGCMEIVTQALAKLEEIK